MSEPGMNALQIAERRDALHENITALREERGRALVKGDAFDGSRLVTAEQALAALSDAESEIYRQRQAAAGEAAQIRRTGIVKLIRASEEKRLAALQAADAAFRELAAALPAIDASTAETARLLLLIDERDLASQMTLWPHASQRAGQIMTGPKKWGEVSWPDPGYLVGRPLEDWTKVYALDLENLK